MSKPAYNTVNYGGTTDHSEEVAARVLEAKARTIATLLSLPRCFDTQSVVKAVVQGELDLLEVRGTKLGA